MADVYAVFGTMLALGIAFPGMLFAWWLLFPRQVDRARDQFASKPWTCLLIGMAGTVALALPVVILLNVPFGPLQLGGALLGLASLAFASLGAAGIALAMSQRLLRRSESRLTPSRAFLSAAVALELAAVFPAIGWFLVLPLSIFAALGASSLALRRPRKAAIAQPSAEPFAGPAASRA
jgi:hypothetical protein